MSDTETPEQPEPRLDPAPDPGPGGPADRVEHPEPDPVTPDQPRSAQVEADEVPDEIEAPEEIDAEEKDVDPGDESPA